MENKRSNSKVVEYTSKDILEEDFLKVFANFRYLEMVLGSCRVDAKHRFVTGPTVLQKTYTVTILLLVFAVYVELALTLSTTFQNYRILQILCIIAVLGHLLLYVLNIIHVRFCKNSKNVEFYIKMQQADRIFKVGYNEFMNTLVYSFNVGTITIIAIVFCSLVGFVFTTKQLSLIVAVTVVVYTQSTVFVEISHCSGLLSYFAIRIILIKFMIDNHLEKHLKSVHTRIRENLLFERRFIKYFGLNDVDITDYPLETYLRDTFNGFLQFQELYKYQIFLFSTKLVVYMVLTFEFVLQIIQNNIADRVIITVLLTFFVFDMIGMFLLCFRYEIFKRNIKKIKILTISVMSVYHRGPLRKRAKIMYHMIEDMPPTFSVYGMWVMEVNVFVKICSIVTGIVLTLLQFALL